MAQIPAEQSVTPPLHNVAGSSHFLQTPPHQHLRRRLPILSHQRLQGFLLKSLAPHKRTVSLDNYSPLLAPLNNVGPCKPRMQFPLPNADLSALALAVLPLELLDVRLQLVEMVNAIVGDADGTDKSGAFCFDKSEPCAIADSGAAVGAMN